MEATERRPFFVYLDEFQSFTTRSLATMTAELRKYGIGIVASHQYLTQVEPPVIDAVLGNAGTIICFRLGPRDAMALAGEFEPKFQAIDLVNLPNHQIYLVHRQLEWFDSHLGITRPKPPEVKADATTEISK